MISQSYQEAVNSKCACLNARLVEIEKRLAEIEEEGYTSAHLITRGNGHKGKENNYLSHSARSDWVQSGKSRMEYVGTKSEKIAAAQARIDRYEEKTALEIERQQINQTLQQVKWSVAQIVSELFGSDVHRAYLADPESLTVA